MKQRRYTKAERGMMYGFTVGAGIGIPMFVVTNNALWFMAIGVGVALGLSIGSGKDRDGS